MTKKSFRDPVTGILKGWGYCATNSPGDVVQDEADDFNLSPGKWRFVSGAWQAYADNNAAIKAQIAAIESKQHRAAREFALTGDKTRLAATEAQIAALRAQLS